LRSLLALTPLLAGPGCELPPSDPLPPGTFAFGVFGDGPYYPWEQRPYRRLLRDVAASDAAWLIHVGDILWQPCSDEAFRARRGELDALPLPVIYTPGDNEWMDCYEPRAGSYDPLDRLASLRRTFFAEPGRSLGARALPLVSQAGDPDFSDFPENVRWERGGFVFATLHMIGSSNGREPFPGRGAAHDSALERRTDAALDWLGESFAVAAESGARGVVLAMHGNVGLDRTREPRLGYDRFLDGLEAQVAAFPGTVLLVHGDSHTQRLDRPLVGPDGAPFANFTRLETFGSPDIGWVRVVLDTVSGQVASVEPRRMRGWW
jgi:hypothetical protein